MIESTYWVGNGFICKLTRYKRLRNWLWAYLRKWVKNWSLLNLRTVLRRSQLKPICRTRYGVICEKIESTCSIRSGLIYDVHCEVDGWKRMFL